MRELRVEAKFHLKMGEKYEWASGDSVIAVMGPTGVGKSYFVRAATGDESVEVGHTLQSGQSQ